MVAAAGGLDGVGGDADVAVGAILEADGRRQPEASSRCTWLSVVRAPMAPQLIRSPMYCGLITSRNSLAAGHAQAVDVDQQLARDAQALVDAVAAIQVGGR